MAVAILLVTHPGIGTALRQVARRLLAGMPLQVECLEVDFEHDAEAMLPRASGLLRSLDEGDGVLLLTDLYGASPSNFAHRLTQLGISTRRVSGLSLPMLLRALNYADRPLDSLADSAAAGARLGVILDHA